MAALEFLYRRFLRGHTLHEPTHVKDNESQDTELIEKEETVHESTPKSIQHHLYEGTDLYDAYHTIVDQLPQSQSPTAATSGQSSATAATSVQSSATEATSVQSSTEATSVQSSATEVASVQSSTEATSSTAASATAATSIQSSTDYASQEAQQEIQRWHEIAEKAEKHAKTKIVCSSDNSGSQISVKDLEEARKWAEIAARAEARALKSSSRNKVHNSFTQTEKAETDYSANDVAGDENSTEIKKGMYCSICDEIITSQTIQEHNKSTLHLFNRGGRQGPPPTKHIALQPSNRGYALLAGLGWREEDNQGLGRTRQGRLEPIATSIRPDNRGIGAGLPKSARPRITHTPADVGGLSTKKARYIQDKLTKQSQKRTRYTRDKIHLTDRAVRRKMDRHEKRRQEQRDRRLAREFSGNDYDELYDSILRANDRLDV